MENGLFVIRADVAWKSDRDLAIVDPGDQVL
jgi:hypothetical protein